MLKQMLIADRPPHDPYVCKMCGVKGQDKRYLQIRCMYAVDEVVPEMTVSADSGLFGVNLCKDCRGRLLDKLREWREDCLSKRGFDMDSDGVPEPIDECKIPVRINGTIHYFTEEEFKLFCPIFAEHLTNAKRWW